MRSDASAPIAPPPLQPLSRAELENNWSHAEEIVVSILCAAYQHEKYIESALCGFLGQKTSFRFEILVRDDASTDATPEIIKAYAERYPGIVIPVLETVNQYPHVRPGIVLGKMARGKYLAHCEADDYWTDPRKLADQTSYLVKYPECSMVCQSHINAEETPNGLVPRSGPREVYLTLTRMYRKDVYADYPQDLLDLPNGDRGLLVHFATRGRVASLSHLSPAVRVMHSGGIMSMQPTNVQLDRQVRTWDRIFQYYSGTRFAPALNLKLAQVRQRQHAHVAYRSSGPQRWVAKFGSLWLRARIFVMRRLGYQQALPAIFTS